MKIFSITLIIFALSVRKDVTAAMEEVYKDPKAPMEKRIEDLLSRMTLEEKGAQLSMLINSWGKAVYLKDGKFDEESARKHIGSNGQGSIHQRLDGASPREVAETTNAVQKFVIENNRLGIPAMFICESLHGFTGPTSVTIFPQAIGLGSTWDPELVEKIGEIIATEARATGTHIGLSPVLDICREPRWGRLEETYGEDPYLVSRLGVAMVKGMQGEGTEYKRIIATVKHFAGHGAPQAGRDSAPVGYGREFLRESALPSFEAAVREAKAGGVMSAYSDWCYTPCTGSHELLTEILRDKWGFQGFVVEDMGAIKGIHASHFIAKDEAEAARIALKAGLDQSFGSHFSAPVIEGVKNGMVSEETLDMAVRRILRTKFLLGLFENPYVDPEEADRICGSAHSREFARQAARESIVLLKNENNALPLSKELKRVAVIGPNANTVELGDYSGKNSNLVSPLQGIKNKLGDKVEILHAEGCKVLPDAADKDSSIAEAAEMARKAEVAIVFIGGSGLTSGEIRDSDDLELSGRQMELVKAVHATKTPMIVVHIGGKPNAMEWVFENAPAVLAAWFPGMEGGNALADVLFGDFNPCGKLPTQWPKRTGQLPSTYDYMHTGRNERGGYMQVAATVEPRYPFGHGLSYTRFEYSNLRVPERVKNGEGLIVAVDLQNTSDRKGTEVAQLYIRDIFASMKRPMRQLKGFDRVTLQPGEKKTVAFTLRPEHLSFCNAKGERVVEPGEFKAMVGGSAVTTLEASLLVE